ncbi:pyridoxamine 5'-phosphate oxidase family protein [Pseudoduganella sp. UC29_71]|uniref:pyridoxamine 5'-phosphate oxidase family protein n=1 Tax=Pseudoduganella sp. UC29_71 TaxID=3350174 RepID=UPI00366C34CF
MDHISLDKALWVADILDRGKELVLASIRPDGTPHASTVSYASDGLRTYCAISLDSQKAHDIREHANVAYAVNTPYHSWADIRGVSIDAKASMLHKPRELRHASELLLKKYPEFSGVISDTTALPWPGMLFIMLEPLFVSVLDYSKSFGHTEYFAVDLGRLAEVEL